MKNDFVTVQGNQKEFKLKKLEYARWLCLIEAIDVVQKKADELKSDMINDDFWVKPLAFQKYIDQRLETMILDVDREEFNMSMSAAIEANKGVVAPVIDADPQEIEEDVEPDLEELEVAV